MGRLAQEALLGNELLDEHDLRARREVDVEYLPGDGSSIETPEQCWSRAAARAMELDPDGSKSFALLRQLQLQASL